MENEGNVLNFGTIFVSLLLSLILNEFYGHQIKSEKNSLKSLLVIRNLVILHRRNRNGLRQNEEIKQV